MPNLQVKNVPEELHERLRKRARHEGRAIRDVVLEAVRRDLDRVAFRERLVLRERVDLGRPAARALDEVRAERERDAAG
jgi:plasmid stability protein